MNMLMLAVAVMQIAEPVKVDGHLDEVVWKDADWCSDMKRFEAHDNRGPIARKTEFAVLADAKTVYVGVRCFDPDLDRLKGDRDEDLWTTDDVELFFGPTGSHFDFYHFAASPASKSRHASFASEGGVIRPDPYAPTWSHACAFEKDAWTIEFAIPFSSFYMTRNADWKTEWVFNLVHTMNKPRELTSWSKLCNGYLEPKRFGRLSGFPQRAAEDDVAMTDIHLDGSDLEFAVYTAVSGDYQLEVPEFGQKTVKVTLPAGRTTVKVPAKFPRNGRFRVEFRCTRTSDGAVFARRCPVSVDLTPIRVRLTTPQYRNNFYPGQKVETVAGAVTILDKSSATVTLEGPGFAKQTAEVKDGGTFSFDVRGFAIGDAKLTVKTAKDETAVKVRNLPPTKNQMVWIEDGHLVVNGRPVLRRNLYSVPYRGGRKFDEKYNRELAEFHITPEFDMHVSVQIDRMVPGKNIERAEAVKDMMPCKEYFDAVDRLLASLKDKDYGYYYICDEPECRGFSRIYLKHMYDYVAEKDPYHPILIASRGGKTYLDCVDWIETHPYLEPRQMPDGTRPYGKAPNEMGASLDAFGCEGRADKVVGFLPTCFAYRWSSPYEDYPTFDEYVLHTYAAMSHGGKSLWPYAYHDLGDRPALYVGTKYVFESFEALQNFFLFGKRTTTDRTPARDLVVYDLADGDQMLLALNYARKEQKVRIPANCGTVREFRGTRTFKGGDEVVLRPDETLIATAKPHDAGLRPLAAVAAQVAAEEDARIHRDNQLVGRDLDIDAKSNFLRYHLTYKLIDGMYDQLATMSSGKTDDYWELTFKNGFKPTFDHAVVHGWGNFAAAEVSVRENGVWTKLPVRSRELTDKYRLALTFDKPVAAEAVRFDFPGKKGARNEIELYELELPKVK